MITCVVGGTVTYTPFPDYAAEVRIGPMVMPGGAAFGRCGSSTARCSACHLPRLYDSCRTGTS